MKTLFYCVGLAILLSGCNPNTNEDALNESPVLEGNSASGEFVWDSKNCAGCHGADGTTPALGESRIISQIDTIRDIENALISLSYPNSDRNPIMKDIALNLSDQEVIDLSEYIFTLKGL